jgi:3-(3-hydroxy-phenyl)propionate hydroxylase
VDDRRDLAAGAADVIVAGAGPVGMTAAALLAACGVRVVVLERNTRTSDEPKAISLDDEALRVYQSAGLAEQILGVIVPGIGTRYYDAQGNTVFQARSPQPLRFGYPFKNPFAQPDLERELFNHLSRHPGVDVLMQSEVTGLTQDANGVEVKFVRPGRSAGTARAAYVLGCDGGRSAVRTLSDVGMTGRSHGKSWLVVDVVEDYHDERYGMHHGDPARPHVIVPGRDGRCRYEFFLHAGEFDAGRGPTPEFALVQRLLAPFRPITANQVERAVIYQFHSLIADSWRVGRSFLLGDAAHMMPPFAGQGLNSGIRDAANLCWKLADVLAGRLEDSALDTYEQERRPHATATVHLSERLGRIVMTTNPRWAARRDAYLEAALRDPATRAFYEEMRYRPQHSYRDGLIDPGSSDDPPVGVMIGQPMVFAAAGSSITLLDDVIGNGWALLGVGVTTPELAAAAEQFGSLAPFPARVAVGNRLPAGSGQLLVDVDGHLDREFAAYRGRIVLLRPDRFVAASWLPGEPPPSQATLHLGAAFART